MSYFSQHFDKYWIEDDVSRAMKQGKVVKGVLRINPRNFEEAYIDSPVSITTMLKMIMMMMGMIVMMVMMVVVMVMTDDDNDYYHNHGDKN